MTRAASNVRHAESFPFAVEGGKIREFADALHDPRPELRSTRAARAAGFPGIVAPIAFTRASVFQEPPGNAVNRMLGIDPSRMRHAGHHWVVHAPLAAGRRYRITRWRVVADERKARRAGGGLRIITVERVFSTASGAVQIVERMQTVALDPDGPADTAGVPPPTESGPCVREDRIVHPGWAGAAPGTMLALTRFGPVGRTDIVRFAGAAGDFTPMHHDPDAARAAGLPDVIAMGMLQTGAALASIEAGYGLDRIAEVSVRFHDPLVAGRSIAIAVEAAADSSPQRPACSFEVTTPDGRRILTGRVSARPAARE